jgi:DNA-binding beta-propeller fold protein YncE
MAAMDAAGDGTLAIPGAAPIPEDEGAPAPPPTPSPETADEDEDRRRRRWLILFGLLGVLLILIFLALWYFLFRQPIPLPLPNTIEMPGYTTSFYGADNPIGVAVSPDGSRIYVAQTEGDRVVLVFDGSGAPVAVAEPPASTGSDHVPVWLAIDPLTSELYVSDRPTGQVYVYDSNGAYQRTLALPTPIQGWQPMGLAFDAAGNLYVTDLGGTVARVEMFDRTLSLVRTFGEADRLSFPNSLAVDAAGNVYVADSNNGRLMVYRPDGSSLAQVGRGSGQGELALPRGVAIDGGARIYVCDSTGQGVLVYRLVDGVSPDLEYLGFFGGGGIADGRFGFPNGVAADGRGRLYVGDTTNDRVQMWSY